MDGIREKSFMFFFLPQLMVNATANPAVGLSSCFALLAELIRTLKSSDFYLKKSARTTTVDLSDFAAFAASVKNDTVFSSCSEHWELQPTGRVLRVIMTN